MILQVITITALFFCGTTIYEDNSCRTICGSYCSDGRTCMFPGVNIWCDPAQPTCMAAEAPLPDLPYCGTLHCSGEINKTKRKEIIEN